jgi:DNA polymerase-3 subunit delta
MGELTYDQLSERMEKGELGGSFFLKTEEPFLRDEAIALLTEAHLAGGSADFDLDQASGDDLDAASLAAMLDTPPMLSPYRVVVIRKAQGLTPKARSTVEEAIGRKVPNRVLILAAEIPRGSKAKFYDVLRRHCMTTLLRAPGTSELPGWLARRAKSVHGVERALAQELEKLVSYVEPAKKIGLAEVRAAVGALPQVDRWSWIDKVADRRIGSALEELPTLLDSGESAVGLIGWLSESLIRVGLARTGEGALVQVLKRDGSYGNLAWKVRTYVRQARQWSEVQIAAALAELLRADRLIKSGGLSERAALEEALLRIASGDSSITEKLAVAGGRGGRSRKL